MCESCGCSTPASGGHSHDHGGEVLLGESLLEQNRVLAEENRARFRSAGVAVVNVLGSPGAGKTSLLGATLDRLAARLRIAVVTGDLAGDEDRRRLDRPGVAVRQIQTGRVCHLDAHMVAHALESVSLDELDLLLLENVGNLVCPAAFDLGESRRALVLSVTEGDDKPSKYPEMFRSADAVILSKIDLAPHCRFDRERAMRDIRRLRVTAEILPLSIIAGDGLDAWIAWLESLRAGAGKA
jgi:hydrogenase nickel incorporation protein HypB